MEEEAEEWGFGCEHVLNTEILISESFEGGNEGASGWGLGGVGELVFLGVRVFVGSVVGGGLEFVAVFVF